MSRPHENRVRRVVHVLPVADARLRKLAAVHGTYGRAVDALVGVGGKKPRAKSLWEKLSPGWYRSEDGDQISKDGAIWWLMMPGRAPAYTQHGGRVSAQREAARVRFNERAVDSDGHFMCPNCGRLGQRMVEARPEQCGLTHNIGDQQRP